ncbi:predicted protein [Chaetoceros tenuissimus]|uniref:Uncharacterized protein n=1 Tax=Chaetoceros tenuissimus TaxID=426638 RepID=A0AAD3CFQ4_9STRA|nr:predicted protein [Chaetoceros tenuissimus]
MRRGPSKKRKPVPFLSISFCLLVTVYLFLSKPDTPNTIENDLKKAFLSSPEDNVDASSYTYPTTYENFDVNHRDDSNGSDGQDDDKFHIDLPRFDEKQRKDLPISINSSGVDVTLKTSKTTTKCRQVYFWGGGKAGSTSLFFLLTRGPGGLGNLQNTGPFVQAIEKEPCSGRPWQKWTTLTQDTNLCQVGNNSNTFTHILNGCPRMTSVKYAQNVLSLSDEPKFLMLLRDPVDRLVSLLNDNVRRGGSKMDIEKEARKRGLGRTGLTLVQQGKALQNLLSVVKDPKQILIIPMESISLDTQGVIDAVMDHVGGQRWKRNETEAANPGYAIMNRGDVVTEKYKYVTLTQDTTEILRNALRQDVLLLESLVGKQFSWSSWARNDSVGANDEREEQRNEAWLVTTTIS